MESTAKESIDILVENHQRFLSFIEKRVSNRNDAEDILQAAFLKSVEKKNTIRASENVVTWFYRLLHNALIDYYRHQSVKDRVLKQIENAAPTPRHPVPEIENAVCRCVIHLLSVLREDYATLIRDVDLVGMSISEVATRAGMTPNSVRVKLHRARAALRKQLEISCGTCTEHGCLDCTCGKPFEHHC